MSFSLVACTSKEIDEELENDNEEINESYDLEEDDEDYENEINETFYEYDDEDYDSEEEDDYSE